MAVKGSLSYLTCPMCDVEVPLSGDEEVGDSIFCPYCQTPLKLSKKKGTEDFYLQEDF